MQISSKNNRLTSICVSEYGDEMKHIHAALKEWLIHCAPVLSLCEKTKREQMLTIMKICDYET